MNNYSLPSFIFPAYSVNFDPIHKKLYSQNNSQISTEFIDQQLESNNAIILDFNRDHSNFLFGPTNVSEAYDYFTAKGYTNIIYLSSEAVSNDSVKFFPTWLYCKSKSYSEMTINKKTKRQYKVSCLNRFPSPHRIYFYYHLLHKSYFNECLTSFLGLVNPYNNFIEIGEFNPIYQHIPNEIKNFYEKTKYNKKIDSDLYNWSNDHNPNHAAYTDSYLNIITESTYYHSFFTEKTAKALASDQLFMLVGGPNSIANLKLLGLECFDDINLEYDSIIHCFTRIDAILDKLDSIYTNIEDLYWHYKKAIDHNSKYFLSSDFRNKCLESIQELLK